MRRGREGGRKGEVEVLVSDLSVVSEEFGTDSAALNASYKKT